VGPRIRLAGPVVEDGRWLDRVRRIPAVQRVFADDPRIGVTTPAEARRAVDSLAALRVDFIKVRNAPPRDAYLALMDQARRRGLVVVGHTPRGEIGLRGAVAAGQRSIEHIDVLPDELDSLTAPARAALFGEMKRAGTWYTPTVVAVLPLTLERGVVAAVVEDTLGLLDPRRAYLSARTLGFWRLQQQLDEYEDPKDWDALLARALGYVGEMHRAGVPLLAGTDMGVRLVYPGFSLHDELALLVERVGLSPREALGTATLQPARFFGEEAEGGTVAAGKRADLVLLDADPLADIRNTQRIRAVIREGRLLSRGELDEILARARGTAAPRALHHP
jgi:imidazolonepropionase-like amidohydrolase